MSNLPVWAERDSKGRIVVDPDIAYPIYLNKLNLKMDKFGAEIARYCALRDLKLLEPGKAQMIRIRADGSHSLVWRLDLLPGDDADIELAERRRASFIRKLDEIRSSEALLAGVG